MDFKHLSVLSNQRVLLFPFEKTNNIKEHAILIRRSAEVFACKSIHRIEDETVMYFILSQWKLYYTYKSLVLPARRVYVINSYEALQGSWQIRRSYTLSNFIYTCHIHAIKRRQGLWLLSIKENWLNFTQQLWLIQIYLNENKLWWAVKPFDSTLFWLFS